MIVSREIWAPATGVDPGKEGFRLDLENEGNKKPLKRR
jgi:hypothetical protein